MATRLPDSVSNCSWRTMVFAETQVDDPVSEADSPKGLMSRRITMTRARIGG